MASCINCGKGLTGLNQTYPLWDGTSDRMCNKCKEKYERFRKQVDFNSCTSGGDMILKYSDDLKNFGFTESGIVYLGKYVDSFKGTDTAEAGMENMKISADAAYAQMKEKAAQDAQRELEKQKAISEILISSGFNFEGYRITKYSGYISGDDAVQIPRGGIFGKNHGQDLTNALVKIRIQALRELKEAAYDLGCNAVIGVDFDYITLEPETANITGGTLYEPYVICVTANGNAVIIEKE